PRHRGRGRHGEGPAPLRQAPDRLRRADARWMGHQRLTSMTRSKRLWAARPATRAVRLVPAWTAPAPPATLDAGRQRRPRPPDGGEAATEADQPQSDSRA